MRKTKIAFDSFKWPGIVFVALLIYSCQAEAPYNSKAAQAARGKAFFDEHCVSCHGENAKGNGPEAENLEVAVPDLTRINKSRGVKEFPIVEIASIIDGRNHLKAHGPRDMPAWGKYFADEEKLTNNEIRGKMGELIAYLMKIQNRD